MLDKFRPHPEPLRGPRSGTTALLWSNVRGRPMCSVELPKDELHNTTRSTDSIEGQRPAPHAFRSLNIGGKLARNKRDEACSVQKRPLDTVLICPCAHLCGRARCLLRRPAPSPGLWWLLGVGTRAHTKQTLPCPGPDMLKRGMTILRRRRYRLKPTRAPLHASGLRTTITNRWRNACVSRHIAPTCSQVGPSSHRFALSLADSGPSSPENLRNPAETAQRSGQQLRTPPPRTSAPLVRPPGRPSMRCPHTGPLQALPV